MYGADQQALNWFGFYLKNRLQRAKVNNVLFTDKTALCGVPQGSILGPLLLIVYINDLTQYLVEAKAKLYANDTTVYLSSPNYRSHLVSKNRTRNSL